MEQSNEALFLTKHHFGKLFKNKLPLRQTATKKNLKKKIWSPEEKGTSKKMSTDNNPIKVFFSKQNAQQLYTYIKRGLEEQYDVQLDNRYMKDLIDIMKMVLEPLPKRIPADVDTKWFVSTLNQQTLKEALPIFADIAKGEALPPALGERDKTLPRNSAASRDAEVMAPNAKMSLGAPGLRPQSTPVSSITDDEQQYQQLREQRVITNPERNIPKFEDPQQEYTDDVNDLYESAEQQRQYRDTTDIPFDDDFNMLSESSTQYGTPLNSLNRDIESFDPDSFTGSQPPRGTERLNKQTVHPIKPPTEKEIVGQQILSFEDIAPQPTQMQMLIPKTSRNVAHDSQIIPHRFVVDSRDRNPAIYPDASEYRLELRQPFIDVVSVELSCATIPLTMYNVSDNNNVIFFEEDPGVTLSATIPVGNYPDATALATAIAASLTAASTNGVTYSASVNPLTDKITLTSDGAGGSIFSLLFFGDPTLEGEGTLEFRREKPQYPPNSIGPISGFDTLDYTGSLIYEAPFVPLLSGDSEVYLHIEELELIESNNAEVHNAFATIELSGDNYARFVPQDGCRYLKYFSPPKGKLAYLTIALRNANGQLIDFNGANHTLSFTVITKDVTQGPYDEVLHERQT